ncbi:hypothetical protein EGW08_014645, partial [Elysia chlorotica]
MASIWSLASICLVYYGLLGVCFIKGQTLKPAIAKDGGNAVVSFDIPDTDQVNGAKVLFVKLDPQNGTPLELFYNILFVELATFKLAFPERLESKIASEISGRTLTINIRGVNASDAGYIRCYTLPKVENLIPNCGQQLIVL